MAKEVADGFVEALRKLEENEDVEDLVEIHTGDCEVGNVSVPGIFRGHEGLREFWSRYRSTFGEMRSEFRNVFATEEGAALEWTTQGTSNGDSVAYDGVSICLSSRHGKRGAGATLKPSCADLACEFRRRFILRSCAYPSNPSHWAR